eukprot:3367626-Prymnesium_polylepis.1
MEVAVVVSGVVQGAMALLAKVCAVGEPVGASALTEDHRPLQVSEHLLEWLDVPDPSGDQQMCAVKPHEKVQRRAWANALSGLSLASGSTFSVLPVVR